MAQLRVAPEIENPFSTGEDFAALLDGAKAHTPEEGNVVRGVVLGIQKDQVIVDIGYKSEGRIPLRDFPLSERDEIKIGDAVEVYLERVENAQQEMVLSRERAVREESWERLERFYTDKKNVDGVIFGRVKGGFTVDLDGAVAFLPGSQVDVRPVKDVGPLMNIKQPFQILKMDRKRGNIVVSRRAILEESRSAERQEALADIREGVTVTGTVKNITDYGAFVDLGAVDGLLHVTDISWKRITHPSEVLKVGQQLKLKVIKFDEKTQRISLGIKQLEESPWSDIQSKFSVDSIHSGTVTNVTDYGAFVELEGGIEGLVHVSEMSWTKKNVNPGKLVSVGQQVKVKILSVEPDKHRLSLGIKQTEANPWASFAEKHAVGDRIEAKVKSVTDFGLFVGLEGEADGLVHLSDLTWEDNAEEALKSYKAGDAVTVQVLDIDPEKERISLGIKQLTGGGEGKTSSGARGKGKATAASAGADKGAVSTYTVTAVNENGIEVQVAEGVTTFIKKLDLAKDRVECRPERFSVGDRVDAMVIGVDAKTKAPKLSIKALEVENQKKAIAEYGSADSGASLGGILGMALDSAKRDAEEKSAGKKKTKK